MTDRSPDPGVEGNARLTAWAAILLFALLAVEGVTVIEIGRLLPEHLFVGFLLVPPVLLKLGSTGYRFLRYHAGDARYRRAGPPELVARVLAPVVVASTLALFGTGIELWLFGVRFGAIWITWHKLAFVAWIAATGLHVLAYLFRAPSLAWADLREPLAGAGSRRGLVAAALLLGLALAIATSRWATPFLPGG